ncbi:MAG: diguanylate cyclase response regulator, partial [Desulfuromonas sp.]
NCLRKEFSRSQRMQTPLSLIMIDLDHFKRVNDTFGHQAGDRVLTTIGHLLADHVRPYDIAARYGGEEFSLLLPETEHKEAEMIAERLRNGISALAYDGELSDFKSTASFGVASCPSNSILSAEDLIREADEALYRAKDLGRNRVVCAA